MNKIQIDNMWKFLLAAAALAIIVGAIFKIQHYPFGDLLFYSGIAAWFFFRGIRIIYKKRQQNF